VNSSTQKMAAWRGRVRLAPTREEITDVSLSRGLVPTFSSSFHVLVYLYFYMVVQGLSGCSVRWFLLSYCVMLWIIHLACCTCLFSIFHYELFAPWTLRARGS
jgi:hypothetical protein